MKQIIMARKDLNMSPGKLAAQVSHASMAFLTNAARKASVPVWKYKTLPASQTDPLTGEKKACMYRHIDLGKFAAQAFDEGKDTFSYRPVSADDPGAALERCENEIAGYSSRLYFDKETYEGWIEGTFTKIICEARNRNHLLKAKEIAEANGLLENLDFFLIKDNCLTELEPEEFDENGIGRTLTCIGFRPLRDETARLISRKYQLYR